MKNVKCFVFIVLSIQFVFLANSEAQNLQNVDDAQKADDTENEKTDANTSELGTVDDSVPVNDASEEGEIETPQSPSSEEVSAKDVSNDTSKSKIDEVLTRVIAIKESLNTFQSTSEKEIAKKSKKEKLNEEKDKAAKEEEELLVGVSLEMGLASSYVFRGLNVLQANSQQDKHGIYTLGASYDLFDTGLTIGYWSAYQIAGNNYSEMVDEGIGHEQDLYLGYEKAINDEITFEASLVYYFYPYAKEDAAGTKNPSWLEPIIAISLSKLINVRFSMSYMTGMQKVLRDDSYLYLNPHISKTFNVTPWLETSIGINAGLKIFKEAEGVSDNMYDASIDWEWTFTPSDVFFVAPSAHLVWTNLTTLETPLENGEVQKERRGAGKEYVVWLGLTTGLDF